jgi:hypothetical protein
MADAFLYSANELSNPDIAESTINPTEMSNIKAISNLEHTTHLLNNLRKVLSQLKD